MYHEYFPEYITALQKELQNHPEILAKIAHTDFAESLGTILAELGILVDGVYTPKELCELCIEKLKSRGTMLVLPGEKTIPITVREGQNEITIERVPNPSLKKAD